MLSKLKPCPFCGGKAKLYQDITGQYVIQCNVCAATMPSCYPNNIRWKAEAIKAWNRMVSA